LPASEVPLATGTHTPFRAARSTFRFALGNALHRRAYHLPGFCPAAPPFDAAWTMPLTTALNRSKMRSPIALSEMVEVVMAMSDMHRFNSLSNSYTSAPKVELSEDHPESALATDH